MPWLSLFTNNQIYSRVQFTQVTSFTELPKRFLPSLCYGSYCLFNRSYVYFCTHLTSQTCRVRAFTYPHPTALILELKRPLWIQSKHSITFGGGREEGEVCLSGSRKHILIPQSCHLPGPNLPQYPMKRKTMVTTKLPNLINAKIPRFIWQVTLGWFSC